jgi:hypothetical protein
MVMIPAFLGALFIGSVVLGPLAWRLYQDRRVERALTVRATVHAALIRALGGESVVAVSVEPPAPWHAGRVVLTAPSDWAFLLARAWPAVAGRVPAGYELVVKPIPVRAPAPADVSLPRAA